MTDSIPQILRQPPPPEPLPEATRINQLKERQPLRDEAD